MRKHIFIAVLFIIITISCSKDEKKYGQKEKQDTPFISKNDRLSFKSNDEFREIYLMLRKLINSKEQLKGWAESQNHSTILESEDSTSEDLTLVMKTLLNKDCEIEIGDSIYWYNNGNIYGFSKKESRKIPELKLNTNSCHLVGNYSSSILNGSRNKNSTLGLNSGDARNQFQFIMVNYSRCGYPIEGGTYYSLRKYVHELRGHTVQQGANIVCDLYLNLKLEWKNSNGSWRPAGEQRYIKVNIYGTASIGSEENYGARSFEPINKVYSCVTGNLEVPVQWASFPVGGQGIKWWVDIKGSIYHIVNWDVDTNGWTNSGSLW